MAVPTRTFGVEIECGYKDADLEVGESVANACGCERGNCKNPVPANNPEHGKALVKRLKSCFKDGTFSKDWSAKTTPVSMSPGGGLTDGVTAEVRVGPVSGEEGLAELTKVMDFLRESGGYVTKADGMHVHFGGEGYVGDNERLKVLLGTWANNREHVKTFVHPNRLVPGRYGCHAWLPEKVANGGGYSSKSMEIRTKSEGAAKTIEFRLFQGTLNSTVACAWVLFVLSLLDTCLTLDEALPAQESPQAFLDAVGAPDECKLLAEGYEFDHIGECK